jgi:ribosomal protein S18 acetylase RimI-like enzyme
MLSADACLVREAQSSDSDSIYQLICHLAEFERAPDEVTNTPEKIIQHGFGDTPLFKAWVAEVNNQIVGMALCYIRYSTWKGPLFYLEDIVVHADYRGKHIGTQLLNTCVEYCKASGYPKLVFQVLDWNEAAIHFYKKWNAAFDPQWVNVTIESDVSKD